MQKKKRRRPIRYRIFMIIFISILIFGGAQLLHIAKNLLGYGEIDFEKVVTIEYKEDQNRKIYPFVQGMVIYDQKVLKKYNLKGIEEWSVNKPIKNPIITTSEKNVFLADKTTGEIIAFDDKGNKVFSISLEKPIQNMVSNKDGVLALYSQNEKNTEIYTFDAEGKKQGQIIIDQGNILDMAISNEGWIGISVMGIEDNTLETKVVLYSKEGKLLGGNKYKDQVITNIFFSETGDLLNVGIKKVMAFSKTNGPLWSKDLPSSIGKVSWNEKGYGIFYLINHKKSIIDTKSTNYLEVIDIKGKELSNIPIKGEVLGIDNYNNSFIAFTERTLYFSKKGKELIEKKINNDIQDIHMIKEDELILVLQNKVQILKVKYKEKEK
ncbi:DUF5711 family protein [Inediibacterium massiliense]|uniref:DUF5711 family protein n=1 Tax=Inediibacterium massiliense TaxID=1658111 RepID=UPI0006B3FC03|nr:DUF5711 family protein [Inediibacterium massiliense]